MVELGPDTVSGSITGQALLKKRVEWKPKSLSHNHKMCIKVQALLHNANILCKIYHACAYWKWSARVQFHTLGENIG